MLPSTASAATSMRVPASRGTEPCVLQIATTTAWRPSARHRKAVVRRLSDIKPRRALLA